MMIFLILAPYAAFALLMLVTSPVPSLFAAAAICLMVIGYDVLSRPLDQDARRRLRDPVRVARRLPHLDRFRPRALRR